MTWGGYDEWRDRWTAAPAHARRRIRESVRAGQALRNPAEASLAVGLALQLLHRHRWSLLVIPWAGGVAAVAVMLVFQTLPAPTWSLAAGVTGGFWLHRLLLTGPRLRQAYQLNQALTRRTAAQAAAFRRAAAVAPYREG